jgi:hypothetical protein
MARSDKRFSQSAMPKLRSARARRWTRQFASSIAGVAMRALIRR